MFGTDHGGIVRAQLLEQDLLVYRRRTAEDRQHQQNGGACRHASPADALPDPGWQT
jgi:hypothetical protein